MNTRSIWTIALCALFVVVESEGWASRGTTPSPVDASFSSSSVLAGCGEPVTFDASASQPAGAIVSYSWDFGDGETGVGQVVVHSYTALGTHLVTLTVTDVGGTIDETSSTVTVSIVNVKPVANAGGPYKTTLAQPGGPCRDVTLDGTSSRDANEPCDRIVDYSWDTDNDGLYGNDDMPADLTGMTLTLHDQGWRVGMSYHVALRVTDSFGLSDVAEDQIQVVAPVALATSALNGNVTRTPDLTLYLLGEQVVLTATANSGYSFSSWTGDVTAGHEGDNPLLVTMNGNKNIVATFMQNAYELHISATGNGTVTTDKAPPYHYGDVVKLGAMPAIGWNFIGWTGDLTGSANPQDITMNSNRSITATFSRACDIAVSAGNDPTVYWGYAPTSSTQLRAAVTGGTPPFSYLWSTGATTQSITAAPTIPTQYAVTVTDATGCTATDEVTVLVFDVRCGNKMEKVVVCHNGHEICISPNAVSAHLAHGDELGPCGGLTKGSVVEVEMPTEFTLSQNYPNPFNPSTVVSYQLPLVSNVRLAVYDLLGREVMVLVDEKKEPGNYEVQFDASNLSGGVYFYRIQAGSFVETRRLLLIR